jgi:hypothetical protein
LDAQGQGYATCEATVQGSCEADCKKPDGALFCDGEYVDHNGTVDECIAALQKALPTINVDVSARGSSSCAANSCQAEGSASASCAFAPSRQAHGPGGACLVLGALGAVYVLRRKQLRFVARANNRQ